MNSNSTEETNRNLAEKPTDIAAFRKSYSIDFCLRDDDGNNVLYIDDASGGHNHSLYLEILNTSERHIELIKDKKWIGNYKASEEHHHFELRFRPGVLERPDAITLKESENWNIGNKQQTDRTISLYLLHKNEQTIINVKDKLVLTLQQVNVSASEGARRTQVELKYKNLKYQGDEKTFPPVPRLQILSIINHYGKRNIPLHVGFVSGDDILNDGSSSNELHLRIANTTLKEVSLKPIGSGVPPKFIISFDTGEADTNPWALGTKSQVAGIKVEVKYPTSNTNEWKTVSLSSDESSSPQWEINILSSLQQLEPGQFFEIKLSDIRTSHPSGHTNLYLRYENIPGYWDGQFVCSIEKTPLLYRDNKIGIGIKKPQIDLAIAHEKTGLHHPNTGELAIYTDGAERLRIDKSGHLGINTTNPQIDLAIGDAQTGLHHPNPGELAIYTNGTERLRIDKSGNVSIGITDSSGEAKLKVSGTAQVQGLQVNSPSLFKKIQTGSSQLEMSEDYCFKTKEEKDQLKIKIAKVEFPEKFSKTPQVVVTARNESSYHPDVFALTISSTQTSYFEVNIIRIGLNTSGISWGQRLYLDWIAWEF